MVATVLLAGVAAIGVGGLGRDPTAKGEGGALRWRPPTLRDPQTIRLAAGPTVTRLDPRRDYVLRLPERVKLGATAILGGHDVVVRGGSIRIPADAHGDLQRRALYLAGATGTVHVEGVDIDGAGHLADAIAINAPHAVVQLENIRISGIRGSAALWHADAVQPWGGVRALRIDRLSAVTAYQGLFLQPDLGPIGQVDLEHVDVRSPSPARRKLLWLTDACTPAPTRFGQVYLDGDGTGPSRLVWPPPRAPRCPARVSRTSVRWPAFTTVSGAVRIGRPPGGSFVPPGRAGIGYASAPYR